MRLLLLLLVAGCAPTLGPPVDLRPDPEAYEADPAYRRAVLVRDLWATDNRYAAQRFERYGLGGTGWDALPERAPAVRRLTPTDRAALRDSGQLALGEVLPLVPDVWPQTDAGWVALGERVFFEYPLRADVLYDALLRLDVDLADLGFIQHDDGSWVGLSVFDDDGVAAVGPTCAQCHGSVGPEGRVTGQLASRTMNVGGVRLAVMGLVPGDLPPEIESSALGDLDRLGPGRADVQGDTVFNPYAIPDFAGIADLPYLQHNANWLNTDIATMAVRCETLFITSNAERTRIPRVLSWALAAYFRSLPPPPPSQEPSALSDRGEAVFDDACAGCHEPPLFTSDRRISVEQIGTDPAATESYVRGTGLYRIPSLRGVGWTAPYLHDGSVRSLESLLDPARKRGGHTVGHELPADDRAALVAFLQTI